MRRDHSAWLVAAPLVAAAPLSAHALAYRLAGSDPQIAADHSAHHYLSHLPVLAAPALLVVVLAVTLRLVRARSGARTATLPWVPVAVAPAPLFALQEGLEALAHGSRPSLGAAAFALGLVLATAFALAALALGRLLLGSAERAAHVAGRGVALVAPPPLESAVRRARDHRPVRPAPARPTGRAPPRPVGA